MDSSKAEIPKEAGPSTSKRQRRLKKLAFWLFIDLAVTLLVIALLLHRPGGYNPSARGPYDPDEVHPYWLKLSSQFYNGVQRGNPFEIVVRQEPLNEAVAQADWPKEAEGVMLYAPAVVFEPNNVVLMGTADIEGVKLIVTVEIAPYIDETGFFHLDVATVKVGAVNVTPLAKMMAKKNYHERVGPEGIETDNLLNTVIISLLTGQSFDPVVLAEDRRARLTTCTVGQQTLTLHFFPLP